MTTQPIFIVDDDNDDQGFIEEIWSELGYQNELLFFRDGEAVFEYMQQKKNTPFLILCDVNIPRMDGFELKENLLKDPSTNHKSIPFIFWSSQVSQAQTQKAYDLGGNGFFIKESTFKGLKAFLTTIMEYWLKSKTPNDYTV